jgi:glycosyltransferase involved in cell wall biosynthesis
LKILLVNHSDSGGGAAVAVLRLLEILRSTGLQCELGVIEKYSIDPAVVCLKKNMNLWNLFIKIIHKVFFYWQSIFFKTSNPILHSDNRNTVLDIQRINNSDYDLVHLHWINYNTISIEDIAKIKKPLVWTLHDSWVFCGAEHHPNILENDQRYIDGYERKNKPPTTQGPDICRKAWERKKRAWEKLSIQFISPSNFEKNCFERSALFRNSSNDCLVIPNIVPENIFKPFDRTMMRNKYAISANKKTIAFGALDITDKKSVKGGYLLLEALRRIDDPNNYQLVIFGRENRAFSAELPVQVFSAGYVVDQKILAELYNLCDVYVCPSLIESFGLTCLEAAFCGVPVTAFNTGGIPDIIEHKKTGYLAEPFEPDDLLNGILYCLENKEKLSGMALQKARKDFRNSDIAAEYIDLYREIIKLK